MPHFAGKKIANKHSSVIDVAIPLVEVASSLKIVSKIVLGVIKQIQGRPVDKSLKITEVPAGLRLRVRGSKTVQEIFIYTRDRPQTTAILTRTFEDS